MDEPLSPGAEATRYAASAVHLDDQLADDLVEEFLAEPRRAVPPSGGVRAATVLREAAAAQARRRVASSVALLLFVPMAVVATTAVAIWTLVAIGWRAA